VKWQDRLVREKLAQQLSHAARHKAKPMTEIFRDKFPAKTAVSETGKGSGVTAEADEYNIDQVPFYDREEAELVYNLCVKAIMLHSVLQEEETEKGVPDKEATQRLVSYDDRSVCCCLAQRSTNLENALVYPVVCYPTVGSTLCRVPR